MASLKADKPVGTQLFGQAKKLKKLLLLKLVILVHYSSKGPASKSAPKQKPQESKKKVYAYILFHNSDQHIKMLHIYMYMVALMMTYSVDCYYVLTQTKLFLILVVVVHREREANQLLKALASSLICGRKSVVLFVTWKATPVLIGYNNTRTSFSCCNEYSLGLII